MITTNTVVVIVFKEGDPLTLEYPAVVTWVLPDGVAWMQPGYMDPWGSPSPQFHRVEGTLSCVGQFGYVAVVENESLTLYLRPADELADPFVIKAFDWYETRLAEEGRERGAEALELQAMLAESLGLASEGADEPRE